MCHCPCSAIGLWFFIRRGKQCLDFTITVHFFHMIGCWIYNAHLPVVLSWWLVNVACIALMAVTGEYLCMRTELRAIPVNSGPKSNLWIFVDNTEVCGLLRNWLRGRFFFVCLQRRTGLTYISVDVWLSSILSSKWYTRWTDLFILSCMINIGWC